MIRLKNTALLLLMLFMGACQSAPSGADLDGVWVYDAESAAAEGINPVEIQLALDMDSRIIIDTGSGSLTESRPCKDRMVEESTSFAVVSESRTPFTVLIDNHEFNLEFADKNRIRISERRAEGRVLHLVRSDQGS